MIKLWIDEDGWIIIKDEHYPSYLEVSSFRLSIYFPKNKRARITTKNVLRKTKGSFIHPSKIVPKVYKNFYEFNILYFNELQKIVKEIRNKH